MKKIKYIGQKDRSDIYKQFQSKHSDKISIGTVKVVPEDNHEKELPIVQSPLAQTQPKNKQFQSIEAITIHGAIEKISEKIKYVMLAFLPISLLILFFDEIKNGFVSNSIQINPLGLASTTIYLLFFSIGILLMTKKRKLKLSISDNYLHLRSFPSFYQKVPIDQIESCKVNAFNQDDYSAFEYLSAQFTNDNSMYSADLEAGIALTLRNGRQMIFGLSNSEKMKTFK